MTEASLIKHSVSHQTWSSKICYSQRHSYKRGKATQCSTYELFPFCRLLIASKHLIMINESSFEVGKSFRSPTLVLPRRSQTALGHCAAHQSTLPLKSYNPRYTADDHDNHDNSDDHDPSLQGSADHYPGFMFYKECLLWNIHILYSMTYY